MNKKGFILSFLICLFSFLFIGNVYALITLDGQDFPDFPNKQYRNVIFKRSDTNGYALLENTYGGNLYLNNGNIVNKNQAFKIYYLTNNEWVQRSGTFTQISYSEIIASTIGIYSSSSFSSTSFIAGYNLFDNTSSVLIFTDTTGYYKNGFYFNQTTIDYIWDNFIEGKSYNYFGGYNYNFIPSDYSDSKYSEPWKKEDFPNLACQYVNNSSFECKFLEDLDSMNFSKDSNSYFYYINTRNTYGSYPTFTFNTSTGSLSVGASIYSFAFNGQYASSWYTNFDVINRDTGVNYRSKLFDYVPSSLPSYLQGYKKVDLTTSDKYIMISNIQSGSVYIPKSSFDEYGGLLSYYDNDLETQPFSSYIQDFIEMPDGEFIRQDFDLSSFDGSDWVMFSKYIYLEGDDDISYSIWIPDDSYDSQVTITPNQLGGNDFDFTYMDENGDIQNGQVSSQDLSIHYSVDNDSSFKGAFNSFLSPIKFIFKTITSLYNNYINSSMQHYFFLVFSIMLIILILRVIF